MGGRADLLTSDERRELARLESRIEKAQALELESAYALRAIRDNRKLWVRQYKTFGKYCELRWDMNKSTANKLITATYVMEALLEDESITVLPSRLSHAYTVARGMRNAAKGCPRGEVLKDDVAKAEVQAAWKEVLATCGGGITVLGILRVVGRRRPIVDTKLRPSLSGSRDGRLYLGVTFGASEVATRLAGYYSSEFIDDLIGELLTISRGLKKAA